MATFSERLRQLRTQRGWSQQRLAEELSISKSSVNMYERGEREPGFETMEAIADIFNVDMNYLHGKSDVPIQAIDLFKGVGGPPRGITRDAITPDDELNEYLEELKNREELRMLFSLTKGATKEEVERAVRILEAALGK